MVFVMLLMLVRMVKVPLTVLTDLISPLASRASGMAFSSSGRVAEGLAAAAASDSDFVHLVSKCSHCWG